ncbi:MAG: hypothetical protein JNL97_15580, partial [Verrucomicrobiales bacterium]|nr:hypothetical protein [Verrucomicrobiales bacterium]
GMHGEAHLWDFENRRVVATLPRRPFAVAQIRFRPDGRRLATADWDHLNDGRPALLWDPLTRAEDPIPMPHRDGVRCVRFDGTGRRVASGGEDNLARVWDAETGAAVTPLLRHSRFVVDLAFSRDDRMVATASDDGTARVWDAEDGQPITPPLHHDGPVFSVRFSADDGCLLTASKDGTVREFDLRPIPWPIEDLSGLAELLSSHRIDTRKGDRTPLSVAEMNERWKALRARHPEYLLDR